MALLALGTMTDADSDDIERVVAGFEAVADAARRGDSEALRIVERVRAMVRPKRRRADPALEMAMADVAHALQKVYEAAGRENLTKPQVLAAIQTVLNSKLPCLQTAALSPVEITALNYAAEAAKTMAGRITNDLLAERGLERVDAQGDGITRSLNQVRVYVKKNPAPPILEEITAARIDAALMGKPRRFEPLPKKAPPR
jgi:hypothetical protein